MEKGMHDWYECIVICYHVLVNTNIKILVENIPSNNHQQKIEYLTKYITKFNTIFRAISMDSRNFFFSEKKCCEE
jgi:hypothetical protein